MKTKNETAAAQSKAAHTPGPWKLDTVRDAGFSIRIGAANDNQASGYVARAYGNNPDHAEANARLIAAAPELLTELEECAKRFDFIASALAQGHTVSISSVQNCAAQARAAIAKATQG